MVSVFTSSPHKVSLQGKNFEGKFSRQKWGQIKTRSVFKQKKIDKKGKNLSFATCNVIAFILYLMIEN